MSWLLIESKLDNGNTIIYKTSGRLELCFHKRMLLADGTVREEETPDELCDILTNLFGQKTLVRVFYGDPVTGRSWMDDCDIAGYVGRSTGRIKVPLLVAPGADGGSALLDHCIVRLDTQSRGQHATVWSHPKFHVPGLKLTTELLPLELPYAVWSEQDDLVARFATAAARERWLRLVRGQRFPDAEDFQAW